MRMILAACAVGAVSIATAAAQDSSLPTANVPNPGGVAAASATDGPTYPGLNKLQMQYRSDDPSDTKTTLTTNAAPPSQVTRVPPLPAQKSGVPGSRVP